MDVKQLAEELNNCESSVLCRFIEYVLKETDYATDRIVSAAYRIEEQNPYSSQKRRIKNEKF